MYRMFGIGVFIRILRWIDCIFYVVITIYKMPELNFTTMQWSIGVQILTGFVNVVALTKVLAPEHRIITSILKLETIVQVVELAFYIIVVKYHYDLTNLAGMRYYDWSITTPLMLLSTAAYLNYLANKGDTSMTEFLLKNKTSLTKIVVYNLFMLFFGYLGETGRMDLATSNLLGFVFFFAAFKELYDEFGSTSDKGKQLFFFMFGLWSLYGVAALMPVLQKNVMFNVLDIFAKNFFGLFLSYNVLSLSV